MHKMEFLGPTLNIWCQPLNWATIECLVQSQTGKAMSWWTTISAPKQTCPSTNSLPQPSFPKPPSQPLPLTARNPVILLAYSDFCSLFSLHTSFSSLISLKLLSVQHLELTGIFYLTVSHTNQGAEFKNSALFTARYCSYWWCIRVTQVTSQSHTADDIFKIWISLQD